MMNSGLPSLLDAIFGKQDLAMVSLDEIYEVIREFPSFNAGHFLLAKKLKLQDDPGYESESMRTALYFNNPFWLQSLLDDGNHFPLTENISHAPKAPQEEDEFVFDDDQEMEVDIIEEESNYTFESYTPITPPVADVESPWVPAELPVNEKKDELDEETEEILEEKLNSDPERTEKEFEYSEPGTQTVTSFDELMAKYHIQPLDMVDETSTAPESTVTPAAVSHSAPETTLPDKENEPAESTNKPDVMWRADGTDTTSSNLNDNETLEEVVNEYGIFEEKVTRKTEHDQDAFDEPLDQIPFVSEKIIEEAPPPTDSASPAHESNTEQEMEETPMSPVHNTLVEQTGADENADVVESGDAPHQTDEHDYDSFDRPLTEPVEMESAEYENKNSVELSDPDPDNTAAPIEYLHDSSPVNGQMEELSERFEEHQKSSIAAFNAKNADSIVFTPYHMVDYFASQGIKLILEDNPPDQFGKQLKSFTDWLKVMKKLPLQHSSVKEDEKENERIRHFAAHSIEERDVLTESMAEVLAKQGMYENAIALFQKLSLIYPPKSAYFASRIEQLKASLS